MKALILAAGFATRLRPLTDSIPKALLEINGQAIIEDVLNQITDIFPDPNNRALITNSHYFPAFQEWVGQRPNDQVTLIDNGVRTTQEKIGSIGDLIFAIQHLGWQHEDILVVASDTLTSVRLRDVISTFRKKNEVINAVFDLHNRELIKDKLGCAVVRGDRITEFVEKPANPPSSWVSIPFYVYPSHVYPHILSFQRSGQSLDSSGSLLTWLVNKTPVYAYRATQGYYYDVGTPEILTKLQQNPESLRFTA